jgi:glutamate racemase
MPQTALAIVDAGIGGLGTWRAVKARSDIPIMYFADSGFEPYGKVPTNLLRKRLQRIFQFLYAQGASNIAVACNAASCALPEDPNVEGIIRHGVDAIEQSGLKNIGLIGGAKTIRSQSYARLLRANNIRLTQRIAQPLSLHVEAGTLDGECLHKDLEHILAPLKDSDAVLLACTHYPAISDQISRHLSRSTRLIDPAELMADWVLKNWHFEHSDCTDRWFTTGDPAKLVTNGCRAFDVRIENPEKITH